MSTDAARDKAIRIEAQEDLYFFTRYMFKERRGYKWMQNWHHLENLRSFNESLSRRDKAVNY